MLLMRGKCALLWQITTSLKVKKLDNVPSHKTHSYAVQVILLELLSFSAKRFCLGKYQKL